MDIRAKKGNTGKIKLFISEIWKDVHNFDNYRYRGVDHLKWAIVGNTGKGKSLSCVVIVDLMLHSKKKLLFGYLKPNPNRDIYANLHLAFRTAHFTPVMFLPFSQLKSCIIIYDDIDEGDTYLEGFIKTSAKRSRKEFMDLFFTCQYYTQLPRKLRKMIDFRVYPNLYTDSEGRDILNIRILKKGEGLIFDQDFYAEEFYDLYDTHEVVDDPTESDILKEIAKYSHNRRDIEKNLMIYTSNRAERKSLFNEVYALTKFGQKEIEKKKKLQQKEAEQRRKKFLEQKRELIDYLVGQIRLNESKSYIKGKLFQRCDTLKGGSIVDKSEFSEIIMRAMAIHRDREYEKEQRLQEEKKEKEQEEKQQQNWYELFILNKLHKISFKDLSLRYKIDKTKIFNKCKEIDFYIKESNLDLIS